MQSCISETQKRGNGPSFIFLNGCLSDFYKNKRKWGGEENLRIFMSYRSGYDNSANKKMTDNK